MTARSYETLRHRRVPMTESFGDEGMPSSGPPSRSELAAMKRGARAQEREFADAYEAGKEDARRESRGRAAGGSTRGGSGTRRSSTRRRRKTPPSVRRGVRELQAPIARQVTSGVRVAGMTLAVVALYHLVETAESQPAAIRGLIEGPAKALRWLTDPTRSIPIKEG